MTRMQRIGPVFIDLPSRQHACELCSWSEVEKEPDFEIHRPQIIHQLQFVGVHQLVRRLDLDDHAAVHEHVDAMKADLLAAEEHLDGELALDDQAALMQNDLQGSLADAFLESKSELVIGFEEAADDRMRQSLFEEIPASRGAVPRGRIRASG